MTETTATISAAETAEYLSKAVGGKKAHWVIWLANERKPGRVNRRLSPEPGPGRPRYAPAAVEAYANDIRAKNLLQKQGVSVAGTESGVPAARRFGIHISPITVEDGAEEPFVLVVAASPLASYRLSAEEARHVAARLVKAADHIEHREFS